MDHARIPRRAILHIGTEKTGTTTIQSAGSLNRRWLMDHGLLYPRTPGDRSHLRMTVFVVDRPNTMSLRRTEGLVEPADYVEFVRDFPADLKREVDASSCPTVLFSNEHMSSRIRERPQVEAMHALLTPIFDKVSVVVYLRPQPELMVSSHSTSIKSGNDREPKYPSTRNEHYYNYEVLLNLWSGVFGVENMIVRRFERDRLLNEDVVDDFFQAIGIQLDSGFIRPARQNLSLDQRSLQFLRIFNRYVPRIVDNQVNPERESIVRALEETSQGPKPTLSGEEILEIEDMFEQSNETVLKRFFPGDPGPLFKPAELTGHDILDPLTAESAVEVAARVFRWLKQNNERKGRRARWKTTGTDAAAEESAET